jgi:excisionase family DNA binding protein
VSSRELLTPKQVADAIGVSESSLKRWCDQGVLPAVRTAGGHRRLPLSGVLRYLQTNGQPLVKPEVLGLPRLSGQTNRTLTNAAEELFTALTRADEELVRRIVLDLYLHGHRFAAICDDVIRPAFQRIGSEWECGRVEVYQERTACELMQRALVELRRDWSRISPEDPLALGGTIAGDNYRIPTSLAELVLLEGGWRTELLGTNLPIETLVAALKHRQPKLVWLSISHVADPAAFLAEFPRLAEAARELGTPVVVGGQALTPELRSSLRFTACCENMSQLDAFAEPWRSNFTRSSTESVR